MIRKAALDSVYIPSEDVVAREIEDAIIIVPIVSGITDVEDELLTLNDTGKAIWQKLDGRATLRGVIEALTTEFSAPAATIKEDVLGLVSELLRRRMVVEVSAE
ncbi:MAG: PqqD family protein [Candidatus Aminicenantes bacterium]|nr:PqqD family protein [Candidatus Aminicenantes bacterium]